MTEELTLYQYKGTSALASKVLLQWTGLPAKYATPGETFAEINPAQAVPTLVLPDGIIITQNVAILSYLAKKAGRTDLLGGDDIIDQSQVLKWTSFLASDVHGSLWVVFFTERYTTSTDLDSIAQVKAAGMKLVQKKLLILENHMKDREFVATSQKTIADAHAYAFIAFFIAKFPDIMKDFPNLAAFGKRMAEDEGVKAAMALEAA